MAKNTQVLGVVALLLIAGSSLGPGSAGSGNGGYGRAGHGPFQGLAGAFEMGSLLKEFHKMTGIMNRVDNLGQLALNPPPPPKLSSPEEILGSAVPDLGGMMETLGPIISGLGLGQGLGQGLGKGQN